MEAVAKFLCQQGDEQFQQALKLNDIDSQHDPETDPYKSKYKARELWHELRTEIQEYRNSDSANSDVWIFLIAILDFQLGRNYNETEEMATGETHLQLCIDALAEYRLHERACGILLKAFNELGILWAGRLQSTKAMSFLKKAEQLYADYETNTGSAPYTMNEMFSSGTHTDDGTAVHDRIEQFESTYTHTLYYMAQVYGQLDENAKAARYCHVTLCRQLKTNTYKAEEWALNAATLSQYYITQADFTMARHCLASALVIIKEAGNLEDVENVDNEVSRQLARVWADIYRCCVKYGIQLLETSWNTLLSDDQDGQCVQQDDSATESKNRDCTFELELTAFENNITDNCVKNFEQARQIFLVVQTWINHAKVYYSLDEHCTDYVEITQDCSNLFKLLSYFETECERQCKMHKRRVDMLLALLDELNPQFYLLICRQVMFELAEVYSAILDLKLSINEQTENPPTRHAVQKINLLAQQSLDKFSAYIDSLKTPEKQLPEKFSDDDERPALLAHLFSGRLHSKFIESDVGKHVACLKRSIECYKYVVDYCDRNPSVKEKMMAEFGICEDMVALLPAKIAKIESHVIQ